ncbi:hypothetical protein LJR066_005760 [Acidovorax sp. LjRoot66]|uniref:hypothetical protein n=1 Tax=Acidovorax sp. LjRoot66 TaxID=3342334 RepID=UPI003ECFB6AB
MNRQTLFPALTRGRALLFSLCAAFLAGCTATTPNIPLDKAGAAPISTVSILRVTESQSFTVRNRSGLSALGGAVGGAIAGGIQATQTEGFVKEYNAGPVRLPAQLVDDLQQSLSARGMRVSYLPHEVAKLKDGVDDYTHIQTDSDALLSVWFGPVGYVADGIVDAAFEPWVVVHVRLLHGKTKQVLAQKSYTAGYQSSVKGAVPVPCAAAYRFGTYDRLMAEFARATQALSVCQKAIAQQVAQDLR